MTDDLEKQADETAPEPEPGEGTNNGEAGSADAEPSVEVAEPKSDEPA